jgi:hypothetical protein
MVRRVRGCVCARAVSNHVPFRCRYYRGGGWAMYSQEQNPWNGNQWLTGGKVLGNWGYVSSLGTYKVRGRHAAQPMAGAITSTPSPFVLFALQYHGVGQAIRWTSGTNHPHLNKITMMSFVFGQVSGNTYDIAAYAGGSQTGFSNG